MGYGDYSHEAHAALTRTREHLGRDQIFRQIECHPLMNPRDVKVRESRDSARHPHSLGVVFALDVTGSMGDIPELLARRELPNFMKLLGDCGVADPQVLFMAIGDAVADLAPLQVGQFEAEADKMDQWLTYMFLEGGGGDLPESYEVAMYFAARHMDMDCFRKRKQRGYFFMTGDAPPFPSLSRHHVDTLIGDKLTDDVPTPHVVAELEKTFEPFFLIPDKARRGECERVWRDLLGDHVICMESARDTCHVSAGLVALGEGAVADIDAYAARLGAAGVERSQVSSVIRAITPFASARAKDGAPAPRDRGGAIPEIGGPSGWKR